MAKCEACGAEKEFVCHGPMQKKGEKMVCLDCGNEVDCTHCGQPMQKKEGDEAKLVCAGCGNEVDCNHCGKPMQKQAKMVCAECGKEEDCMHCGKPMTE